MRAKLSLPFIVTKLLITILTILLFFVPLHYITYLDGYTDIVIRGVYLGSLDLYSVFLYIFIAGVGLNLLGIWKNLWIWDFIIALAGFIVYLTFNILNLSWLISIDFSIGFYIVISVLILIFIEKFWARKAPQKVESITTEKALIIETEEQKETHIRDYREISEIQDGKREFIEELEFNERIKTDSNFPERWAMKYGKKPFEKENFQFFQEREVQFSSEVIDPIYFHLKMLHLIEDLNYRIEINKPPISETHQDIGYYEINGEIMGTIRKSKRKSGKKQSPIKLIFGAIFLIVSILLIFVLILNIIPDLLFTFILFLIVLVPLSLYLIIVFLLNFFNNLPKGYIKIYLIEHGSAYSGIKKLKEKSPNETFIYPIINTNLKISLAGSIYSMGKDKLEKDLKIISEVIEDTLS